MKKILLNDFPEPIKNIFLSRTKKKKGKRPPKGMIILPNIAKTKKIKFDEYGMPYHENVEK